MTPKTERAARTLHWLCIFSMLAVVAHLQFIHVDLGKLGLFAGPALGLLLVTLWTASSPVLVFDLATNRQRTSDKTRVFVTAGGCVVPLALALYVGFERGLSPMAVASIAITVACAARLSRGRTFASGVAHLVVFAPLVAALMAPLVLPQERAAGAFSGGIIGVLVGADLLDLYRPDEPGLPIRIIGSLNSLDAILLTGLFALLMT